MTNLQPVNTTYEPFSLEPEYIEANREFIRLRPLFKVERFLDLACGTGTVSELLAQASPKAHLNGVDYDPVQIELASRKFRALGHEVRHGFELSSEFAHGKPVMTFAVGSADVLPFPDETFDCVTICNAIHVLPDKDKLLRAIRRVLRRGGLFGFNSAFYAGTYPPGTEAHYYEWLRLAILHIQELSAERVAQGQPPIKRQRGSARKAFQNRWDSPQEWCDRLVRHGLKAEQVSERVVMLDERCFAAVGVYGGLAEVLLSGYPVDSASQALQATAKASLEAMKASAIPRNWLEIWAVKA